MRRSAAAVTTQTQCAHLRVTLGSPFKTNARRPQTRVGPRAAAGTLNASYISHALPCTAPPQPPPRTSILCASSPDVWQTFKTNARHRRLQWARAHLLARCARLTSHTQPCAAPPQHVTAQTQCAHLRLTPGRQSRRMLDTADTVGPDAPAGTLRASYISHPAVRRSAAAVTAQTQCAHLRRDALAGNQDECSTPQTPVGPRAPAGTQRASYISHPAVRRSAAAVTAQTQCAHLRVTPCRQSRRMLDTADSSGPARTCWHAARVLHLTPSHAPLGRSRHNANTVCASPRDAWQTMKTNARHRRLQWARAHLLARCARLTTHTQPCTAPPQPSQRKHGVRISA